MKKLLLLFACMATMVANAQVRLPMTGRTAALPADVEATFTADYGQIRFYDSAQSGNGNNDQNIDPTVYKTLHVDLDDAYSNVEFIFVGTVGGEANKAKYRSITTKSLDFNLSGLGFDEGTNIVGIKMQSKKDCNNPTVHIYDCYLLKENGDKLQLNYNVAWNVNVATYSGVATFTGSWQSVGGTAWEPTRDTGFSLYVVNFAEPVTDKATFQFYTKKDDGTSNRTYSTINAGVTSVTYKTDNADNSAVAFQTTNAAATYPATLNIGSITRYESEELYTITVNPSVGISSFVTDIPLMVPGSLEVYMVKDADISTGEVTLTRSWGTESSPIKPGAYFVRGTTSDQVQMFTAWNSFTKDANNILKGSTAFTGKATENMTRYALSNQDGMLHPVAEGVEIPAGKAYLEVPTVAAARALKLVFDDEVTGVTNIATENAADARYFNLQGQRVNANTKGIVIKNGRKYINK